MPRGYPFRMTQYRRRWISFVNVDIVLISTSCFDPAEFKSRKLQVLQANQGYTTDWNAISSSQMNIPNTYWRFVNNVSSRHITTRNNCDRIRCFTWAQTARWRLIDIELVEFLVRILGLEAYLILPNFSAWQLQEIVLQWRTRAMARKGHHFSQEDGSRQSFKDGEKGAISHRDDGVSIADHG